MKLKRIPEDFRVEELPIISPGQQGRYLLYRLKKRGLGTPEAIEAIRRRWNLSAEQIRHGGLKDRHALTTQFLTIHNGPDRSLHQENLELEPVGRLPFPYGPAHFRGNRFDLVLRDLTEDAMGRARQALDAIPKDGLPNYFDDQRFGSVGFDGGFVALTWLQGNHEQALRLAIAEPNPHDRPGTQAEKAILREHWGNWPEAKARLDRSHARSLVTYLVDHPTDFRGAFARVRRDLRSLYFSAFQSYLWNLILGSWIEQNTSPEQRVPIDFRVARLPIHRDLEPTQAKFLAESRLPLPASRTPLPAGPIGDLAQSVVATQDLSWEQIRVRHLKDVFFSKGNRPALFFPENLDHDQKPDDLYPGRHKLLLSFELPKGAYATLLVKRITDAS